MNKQFFIPKEEIRITYSRSSGAGGQNVNKVNSKVTLHWNLRDSLYANDRIKSRFLLLFSHLINLDGEVVIVCQEHRSQKDNLSGCLEKLHALYAKCSVIPKIRKKTKPHGAAVKKRLDTKKKHSIKKKQRGWDQHD